MERLIRHLAPAVALWAVLGGCGPEQHQAFAEWDPLFDRVPSVLLGSATGLWWSSYQEDTASGTFERTTALGAIPEKLEPDGLGGWTVAVPVLVQGETSEGPLADRFETVLVRIVRSGDEYRLVPQERLPGEVRGWHDEAQRTLRFRGVDSRTLWSFHGRY